MSDPVFRVYENGATGQAALFLVADGGGERLFAAGFDSAGEAEAYARGYQAGVEGAVISILGEVPDDVEAATLATSRPRGRVA